MRRITNCRVLDGYRIELDFDNGVRGTVDLSHLAGRGVFQLWEDRRSFEDVKIGPNGDLHWSDTVELCPDALYLRATGQSVEAAFPDAMPETAHA